MELGNLTEEQQQALQQLLASVPKPEAQPPAGTPPQQQAPPTELSFTWGGQQYQARDQSDLQAKLAEIQQQESSAREQERLRFEAQNRPAPVAPTQGPNFDKERYATLFLTDPVQAQEYLQAHTPSYQAMQVGVARAIQELQQNQAVTNFIQTSDYEPNDRNWSAIQSVMGQLNLPLTFNGLQAAYAFAKSSGVIKSEAAPQQQQAAPQSFDDGFQPPPMIPRGSSPSRGSDESDMLDRFEGLPADQMKVFLESLTNRR